MMIWSLCLIFSFSNSKLVFASPAAKHLCSPDQKDALWEFKSEFYVQQDPYSAMTGDPKTETWRYDTDCCFWDGVSCDPKTGKVVELDLWNGNLNGPLRFNSSLFRLEHLQSLVLVNNNMSGILPDSIGNLKYLTVLNLGSSKFFGKIPSSIGNLSHLTYLDLSCDFTGELPDTVGKLNRLKELLLVTKLSGNFPHVLLNLSEVTRIDLRSNFQGMLPSNMSSLSKLEDFDITGNSFSGSIPSSLFMLPSLVRLLLSRNYFSGSLEIGNISSPIQLRNLDVGDNNFSGPIPVSISKLVNLSSLDLSFWDTGRAIVDFSIFVSLKSLRSLDLPYLNTRSAIDMSLFSHLASLSGLDLSGNTLKISSTSHLPSPIYSLMLSSCNISEFPKFLQNQTSLIYLDISANQITGHVPEWLWSLPYLRYVNISQNSFNEFEGSTGIIQTSAKTMLDISSNLFHDLPLLPNSMMFFSASNNLFSGEIPRGICELLILDTLVLSNNNFNGSIPQCFNTFNTTLSILHLQNNSLSGVFWAESVSDHLRSLDLGNNQFSGELPKSLINCTRLEFLNVENNKFRDKFPSWLRLLPNLQILVLRSNEFYGPIYSPGDSFSFPKLRIFDISNNLFTGVLPSAYFSGWSAMSSVVDFVDNTPIRFAGGGSGYYHKSVGLTYKGLSMELVGSVLMMYITIDVSENRFEGDFPESISLLKELIGLNMSNNAFTGHIPPSLVNLTNLQSLDLSLNRLSGKIPPELGKLTFLSKMNFSHNMLGGLIPQGTQIQSQDISSFAGNPWLCGAPLQETCDGGGEEEEATNQEKGEEDQILSWLAAAIGYVPGVFCGFTIGHILISYKHDWFIRIFHPFA